MVQDFNKIAQNMHNEKAEQAEQETKNTIDLFEQLNRIESKLDRLLEQQENK